MKTKISVIVPVYKVEAYLERCIKSIVNQTYENLEIILVDDGSLDSCPALCDQWAQKDARIKVIHKENGGLSDARNAGMQAATGTYMAFVDSDDWLHIRMYEVLMYYMQRMDADIVECKALITHEKVSDSELDIHQIAHQTFGTEESMVALIAENPLHQTAWNKLYKTEKIKDILFAYGKCHEDEFWTYQALSGSRKTVFLDVPLYYYFQREDSIMGSVFSCKRLDALEGRYQRYCFVKEKYPALQLEAKKNLVFISLYYCQQALRGTDRKLEAEFIRGVHQILEGVEFDAGELRKCSAKERLWIKKAQKSLESCCKLRNMLKIGVN